MCEHTTYDIISYKGFQTTLDNLRENGWEVTFDSCLVCDSHDVDSSYEWEKVKLYHPSIGCKAEYLRRVDGTCGLREIDYISYPLESLGYLLSNRQLSEDDLPTLYDLILNIQQRREKPKSTQHEVEILNFNQTNQKA